ncbi:MAG: flippase-like domain-containing protein [Gammaproteobacteria bacterium]|nr:flippase-like domain-containing protein [Gammaproteobacteria bacterium]
MSLSLVLAAVFYLGYVIMAGYENLISAITTLGLSGCILILSSSFSSYYIRFLRWHYFIRRLGHHLPILLHFQYYLAGFALTTTPAKAGETIRSIYLKNHGINISHSLASFFCERFLDVIIVGLLATLTILDFDEYNLFILIIILFLLILLGILRNKYLQHLFHHLATQTSCKTIKHALEYMAILLRNAHILLQLKPLSLGLISGAFAWAIQGIAFYYILFTLNIDITFTTAIAIYAISLLAGAISFIPGGIGATEAVMYLLLVQMGVDTTNALIIPLISRISTLWFAVFLGLFASLNLSLKKNTTNH